MGYGLEGRRSISEKEKNFFSLLYIVNTGSEAHPTSNLMGNRDFFPQW
jgi:hypothetical protein